MSIKNFVFAESAIVRKRGVSCNYLTLICDVFVHARHEKSGTIETNFSMEFDQIRGGVCKTIQGGALSILFVFLPRF